MLIRIEEVELPISSIPVVADYTTSLKLREWIATPLAVAGNRGNYVDFENTLTALSVLYHVEQPVAVYEYLRKYPFIIDLLLEALPNLENLFPNDPVRLRVVEDTEQPQSAELFAVVQTALTPEEAFGRLMSFDELWWLQASQRACCKINFTFEHATDGF